ncbi:MAG: PAS domain S-box protein [Chitinispirillaceae bacterium]
MNKDEEKLKANGSLYRSVFENIQDVYYETSLDGIILELSPSIETTSKYTREELIGASLDKLYANPAERRVFIDRIKAEGKVTDYEITLTDKDGTPVPCSVTARLIAGAPVKILGILRDISIRKKYEQALAESETLYRSLVEQSPISIARIGRDGKFVFVNKRFLSWSCLPLDGIIGHGPEIFQPLMDQEMMRIMIDAVTTAMTKETKTECELAFTIDEGSCLWIMQVAYPWRAADGSLCGVEVQGYDITHRKQAENLLRESSETFSRIFNLGPLISVITTVKEGRFVEVNDAFVSVTGYSREEIIGKSSLEYVMIRPEVREKAVRDLLKNGYSVTETAVRLKSGEERVGLFYARQIMFHDELCQLQNVIDITDLKRGQESLQRSYDELESRVKERTAELSRSNAALQKEIEERKKAEDRRRIVEEQLQRSQKLESLGVLAGGIAHDFNNLLAGLFGNISLARLSIPAGGEAAELLDQALGVFSRAKNLTQQILTFSKGGHPVKKIRAIGPVIKSTVRFALSGADCTANFNDLEKLWPCDIDENQISQVIENIVINARQAMPTGGVITVVGENIPGGHGLPFPLNDGNYVRISIHDQGCGITRDHLPLVFDPFFTTKQEGSGLGLATSYSIVRKHGGCITVDSELGKGSSFHIYLPALPGAATGKPPDQVLPHKAQGRILVMDDDPYIRQLWEKTLQGAGYTFTVVATGEAAVEAYEKAKAESPMSRGARAFDCVILDLTVPGGMGGKTVIGKLCKIDPGVKGIATSGYSDDPVLADPGRFGFRGRLVKPFTFDQMILAVQEAMSEG